MKLQATKRGTLTLPNFLIIGAVRSGSSALTTYLRQHPQVFMSERKELEFFDVYFDRGLEWYGQWFKGAGDSSAIGEASPSYMYDELAPRRIADVLPEARLIAILRNPVDRAYSHYWRVRSRGREPLSFTEAIEAEPARLASVDVSIRRRVSYLDRGRYFDQLIRVSDHVPRDRVEVLIFEELLANPERVYGGLCEFLGIDDAFRPSNLGRPVGRHKTYRSSGLLRLNRRVPVRVERAIRRWNEKLSPYPAMDASLRRELLARFEPETAALEAWLGRDLSVWRT
jgi:hypothetical protein